MGIVIRHRVNRVLGAVEQSLDESHHNGHLIPTCLTVPLATKGFCMTKADSVTAATGYSIALPYGDAQFNAHDLVDYIRSFTPPRDYIIIGKQKDALVRHRKKTSLDYWLRRRSRRPDTMQAVDSVVYALVATKLFVLESDLLCPESHRHCKGLRLV